MQYVFFLLCVLISLLYLGFIHLGYGIVASVTIGAFLGVLLSYSTQDSWMPDPLCRTRTEKLQKVYVMEYRHIGFLLISFISFSLSLFFRTFKTNLMIRTDNQTWNSLTSSFRNMQGLISVGKQSRSKNYWNGMKQLTRILWVGKALFFFLFINKEQNDK